MILKGYSYIPQRAIHLPWRKPRWTTLDLSCLIGGHYLRTLTWSYVFKLASSPSHPSNVQSKWMAALIHCVYSLEYQMFISWLHSAAWSSLDPFGSWFPAPTSYCTLLLGHGLLIYLHSILHLPLILSLLPPLWVDTSAWFIPAPTTPDITY